VTRRMWRTLKRLKKRKKQGREIDFNAKGFRLWDEPRVKHLVMVSKVEGRVDKHG